MLKKLILMFPPLNTYLQGWIDSGASPPESPEGRAIKALVELMTEGKASPVNQKKSNLRTIIEQPWL